MQFVADLAGYYLAASPTPTATGAFGSVAPYRVLDTRIGNGAGTGSVAAHDAVSVQVEGVGHVPSSGVSAVAVNVTVTGATANGVATVFADGESRPLASNLNFVKGITVPNLVIAPVGADGKIVIYNGSATGSVQFVADVSGYFLAGTPTVVGAFGSVSPYRVLDTRTGNGATGPVADGHSIAVQVTGRGGVPASGVSAVAVNVTVTGPTKSGVVTVYADGATRPLASNLNFSAGQTVPNLVMAPVGSDGKIDIYNNSSGTSQFVADVAGYYLSDAAGDRGPAPCRTGATTRVHSVTARRRTRRTRRCRSAV